MLKETRELILENVSYNAEVEIVEKTDKDDIVEMYSLWNKFPHFNKN